MKLLNALAVTTAVTGLVSPTLQLPAAPRNLVAQFNFVYGSGGTTLDVYLQTSLDGGATWIDIANFHVTTSSLRKVINLKADTAVTTSVTPSDGAITANTTQDGILGPLFRAKYTSTGTYAGTTTIDVAVSADQVI